MRLPRIEQVVRAVCSEHYDRESGRVSPSLYAGIETSLSRLSIIPLLGQWAKLAATVQKLPGRRLERIGEIGVGQIEDIAQAYSQNGRPTPMSLTVVADPTLRNHAHAVIPEKVTRGMSRGLKEVTTIHDPPEGFDPGVIPRLL